MRRTKLSVATFLLVCCFPVTGWGGTLYVPSQYAGIAGAVKAAVDGDIVLLADGVYCGVNNKRIRFEGKAITIRSQSNDPAKCVIDCKGNGRGFLFWAGETASSILEGISVRNGYSVSDGGGILCIWGSSPTIRNCIIENCKADGEYRDPQDPINAWGFGGGISCRFASSPIIEDCVIRNNAPSSDNRRRNNKGGDIACCEDSNPVIRNCTIEGAATDRYGHDGGIFVVSSGPTIEGCTIRRNFPHPGDAASAKDYGVTGNNRTSAGGTAFSGAGIALFGNAYPDIISCRIYDNRNVEHAAPTDNDGGAYVRLSEAAIRN